MGPVVTTASSVMVLMELLKSVLTHLLHRVQHSLQDGVIKIKSVQQSTDREGGDLITSTLLPEAQIGSPALFLIPALWPHFRNLIYITKPSISVLPIKTGEEKSTLALKVTSMGDKATSFSNVLQLVHSSETVFTNCI